MTNVVEVIVRATGKVKTEKRAARSYTGTLFLWAGLCLLAGVSGFSQQTPVKTPKEPAPSPAPTVAGEEQPLPGDWAPSLLYGILSSPNEEAQSGLLRATFAAGPAIIPQLSAALGDDRTAEFAAQAVAYIGGDKALPILWKLLTDPRDLNLRRFTYGALAEYETPQATNILFDLIDKSDAEPDRTVTESAVIALTVRTDTTLLARIQASEKQLQDVVIRDDLENARMVIAERAKYLATPEGKKSGDSIESAVRSYFIPALEPPPAPVVRASAPVNKSVGKAPLAAIAPSQKPPRPMITVDIRGVTFSPDKNRALAQVIFADPTAEAYYEFVLQKHFDNWTLASVWLGPEVQKPGFGTRGTGLGPPGPDAAH
jgi:hypothetical protein